MALGEAYTHLGEEFVKTLPAVFRPDVKPGGQVRAVQHALVQRPVTNK
jgi:hypothetical protein